MTDRRRNLFILLLVGGLLAGVARRRSRRSRRGWASTSRAASCSSTRPSRRKQSPRSHSDAIDRAIDIMRERVDQLGVAEPEIQRSGADQIDVALPGRQERRRGAPTRSARPPSCTSTTGRRTSSAPDCKPAPTDPNVTGGAVGRAPAPAALPLLRRGHARQQVPGDATSRTTRPTGSVLPRRHEGQAGPRRPARRPSEDLRAGEPQNERSSRPSQRGRRGHRRASIVVQAARRRRRRQGRRRPTAFYVLQRRRRARAARTSRTPSRTSTTAPAAAGSRTSPSTSPTRAATSGRTSRARSPSAARQPFCRAATRRPRSSTSRSCSTTS